MHIRFIDDEIATSLPFLAMTIIIKITYLSVMPNLFRRLSCLVANTGGVYPETGSGCALYI